VTLSGKIAQTNGRLRGPLLVAGSFEWSGGEQVESATTEISSGGKLSISTGYVYLEKGRTLQVDAGASATMGVQARLFVGEGALVSNAGTFNADGHEESGGGIFGGVSGTFRNTGTFSRSGNGYFGVGVAFENEGTVVSSLGSLRLEGGGVESSAATFSGAGTEGLVNFAGGTFTFAPGVTLSGKIAQTNGRLRGPLIVKGRFEWSGGNQTESTTEIQPSGELVIEPGSVLLEQGRVLRVDTGATAVMGVQAQLYIGENASVINSGTFTVEGSEENASRIYGATSGKFRNPGTFSRSGSGSFSVGVAFENEGTVVASLGSLRLEGGGVESSAATFSGAGTEGLVNFAANTFTFAPGVTLSGKIAQTGGRLKGPLMINGSFEWSGGEQVESATTEVSSGGKLTIPTGYVSIEKGRTLEIDAGASASMGIQARLFVGESATILNAGAFSAGGHEEGGGGISGSPAGAIQNTGTFTRQGEGAFPVEVPFYNEGVVDIDVGILTVRAFTQTSAGVLSIHLSGASLGTGFTQLNVNGKASVAGKLRISTENGFHPEPGQHFQIVNGQPMSGTFSSVEEVGTIGGGWSYETISDPTSVELVVAGGPVPTVTSGSISGAGETGSAITVPEGTVVTASASLSGSDIATASGSISYRVYSDPGCRSEVANAGTVAVSGGAVPPSSPEVFPAGTYYWQVSYSGDATNQRSSTACGSDVEVVQASGVKGGDEGGGKVGGQTAVSGHSANLIPVSGAVSVRLPGNRGFQSLKTAKTVPVGSVVDAKGGHVTLCRAQKGSAKECAEFNGGQFRIEEKVGAATAHVALSGGSFAGCPGRSPNKAAVARSKGKSQAARRLWGSGHGHFTTDGRNSSTTVRGTIWYVEDRCDYTLTRVMRGVVVVYDDRLRRSVSVRAGHSYIAYAR
jgi:hypothetical protein